MRDPIVGSDWRNDGGRAIIIERGNYYVEAEYQFGSASNAGGGISAAAALGNAQSQLTGFAAVDGLARGILITAPDGAAGFTRNVIIVRNGDGARHR